MNTAFLEGNLPYDGSALRAHWIQQTCGLIGNALVAWRGPCRVLDVEMADLEDLDAGPGIAGDDMVHFIWECFDDQGLVAAILRQRLFASRARDVIAQLGGAGSGALERDGDDLYLGDGKLSISVATCSGVSTLIHFALNAENGGAPVKTAALSDLKVDPKEFMEAMLEQTVEEEASIARARALVRPKGEFGVGR